MSAVAEFNGLSGRGFAAAHDEGPELAQILLGEEDKILTAREFQRVRTLVDVLEQRDGDADANRLVINRWHIS